MNDRVLGKFQVFYQLSLEEKTWFISLYVLSGIARLAVITLPFRWIIRLLGQSVENRQLCVLASQQQLKTAHRIGLITNVVSKYTPWQTKCLIQAMIARYLLGYYRIPYVLYIGIKNVNRQETELKGHAWLCVGHSVITGRQGHHTFTIASSFVSPSVLKTT